MVEQVIRRLREKTGLGTDDVDDVQLLAISKGTYLRAVIEFDLACENLGICVKNEIERVRNKMNNDIGKHLKRIVGI